MRLLFALLMALVVGQSIVPVTSAAADLCLLASTDDVSDGQCAPSCTDCVCCLHGAPPLLTPHIHFVSADPASARLGLGESTRAPFRDPSDVFHVPKPALG